MINSIQPFTKIGFRQPAPSPLSLRRPPRYRLIM